ncbi:FMN-dependent NADH-azoreductase [Streptomyces sp. NPDC048171]|uniref:FMN-dependent NADH-azoreductase n=1 Tax=Streptomyces sp. NPDC048171 TaxID=3365504 RepID=UPI00371EBB9D
MATLLHIDSSVSPHGASVSRFVTETFRKVWEEQHPDGTVVYRDLAACPVPHFTADSCAAEPTHGRSHTPEQSFAATIRRRLIEELEDADAILIGAPMHNYTIPSTLKAWIDNVVLFGRTVGEGSMITGTPTTVVTSRGLSYAPGTPDEGHEYVQNYLDVILGHAMRLDVGFIVPEFTYAPHDPAVAALLPLFEWSRDRATKEAEARAKTAGGRSTADA